MLPPHELKNKDFTRVVRGYNPVEVDDHIRFIIEKYTELYRENDELERKLKTANAKIDEFKNDEESIRSALINAQRASAKITIEANERAEIIIRSAKTSCDSILAEFKRKIIKERDTLIALNKCANKYKERLLAQYKNHLEFLDKLSPDVDISEYNLPEEVFTARIVQGIKNNVENYVVNQEDVRLPEKESKAPEANKNNTENKRVSPQIGRIEKIEKVEPETPVVSGSATPKTIYRVKSVKETIKQLNKSITGKDEAPGAMPGEVEKAPMNSGEVKEFLQNVGSPEKEKEFVRNNQEPRAKTDKKPLTAEEEFNIVYSTPENYEEEMKKTKENKK